MARIFLYIRRFGWEVIEGWAKLEHFCEDFICRRQEELFVPSDGPTPGLNGLLSLRGFGQFPRLPLPKKKGPLDTE